MNGNDHDQDLNGRLQTCEEAQLDAEIMNVGWQMLRARRLESMTPSGL